MFMTVQIALQRSRFVSNGINIAPGHVIVREFHNIVEVLASPAHVQNVDEAVMRARDRFERGHALKFTLKRAFAFKRDAIDHFDRPPRSGQASGQPYFAVGAATNDAEDLMIWNEWDLRRNGRFRRALAQRINNRRILHKRGLTGNRRAEGPETPRTKPQNPRN